MGNSIEDDIKNAEHFIDSIKADKEYKEENGWHGYYNKEIVELARMLEHILSDYKRVLKENEELKNNIRKNENELEFDVNCDWITLQKILDESEKNNEYISYKDEKWIKEKYCIPVQKIKDKIEKEIKYHERNILEIENITMLKGKTAKEEAEIEFNKYAIVVLKKILQKLREGEN